MRRTQHFGELKRMSFLLGNKFILNVNAKEWFRKKNNNTVSHNCKYSSRFSKGGGVLPREAQDENSENN